jgi:phage protein D
MTPSNAHALVEIDGTIWDSWKHPRLFKSVSIELATGEASQAVWEFFDPEFKLLDRYTKADGVPLAVMKFWLGYGEISNLGAPVFEGLLGRVERTGPDTTLLAYDMGFKMRLVKRPGYHNKLDDLAIIKKLAERNGLKFEGPEKPLKLGNHDAMIQDEQTDWEHVAERAQDAGLVLFVRSETLYAKYPAKTGVPKLNLDCKRDSNVLRDFHLTYNVPENQEGRSKKVEVRGRGRGGKRLSGASEINPRGNEHVSLKKDLPKHTKSSANARAQAQKELEREHSFSGSVKMLSPLDKVRIDVRDTLELQAVGKLFGGKYICDKVAHDFSSRGLFTSFELFGDIDDRKN